MYTVVSNHNNTCLHTRGYTNAIAIAKRLSSLKTNCSNHSPNSPCFRPEMSGRAWVIQGLFSKWGYGNAMTMTGKAVSQKKEIASFCDGKRLTDK